MKKTKIEILSAPTKEDLREINILIPQTAAKPHLLSMRELKRVTLQKKNCKLVVARCRTGRRMQIVGMAVVAMTHIPTGLMAIIEDVIVDETFRGRGFGRKIVEKLIEIARKNRAKHISLKTMPGALPANEMYKSMGFFQKEAVYYRINLFLPKPNAK